MTLPESGTFEMYAEVSFGGNEAFPTFFVNYDRETTVEDVLRTGCRALQLELEEYDMCIEVPVGIPGTRLRYQVDNLNYVRLPICLYDGNFVSLIRGAQIIASEHPSNITIAADLLQDRYLHLFKVYIAA